MSRKQCAAFSNTVIADDDPCKPDCNYSCNAAAPISVHEKPSREVEEIECELPAKEVEGTEGSRPHKPHGPSEGQKPGHFVCPNHCTGFCKDKTRKKK